VVVAKEPLDFLVGRGGKGFLVDGGLLTGGNFLVGGSGEDFLVDGGFLVSGDFLVGGGGEGFLVDLGWWGFLGWQGWQRIPGSDADVQF